MQNLDPSMRLKVNRDTVYIPDSSGGIYFRNNTSSFQMKGSTIAQWIEKLMPMFTGEYTLAQLTGGLMPDYRERVLEIAGSLFQNGYVRDVSGERSHQLTEQVLERYGPQIEFLDGFGGSGAARFEDYRRTKVLAAGSGPFFVALVSSLLGSGLSKFHMKITNTNWTDRRRIKELADHARLSDPDAAVEEADAKDWAEAIRPFEAILYVSEDKEELQSLAAICREEGKILIPALMMENQGVAGPVLYPEQEAGPAAVFRSIQSDGAASAKAGSSAASAMLANLIAFEWLKTAAGLKAADREFYLLDLETLEGEWHPIAPHPDRSVTLSRAGGIRERIENEMEMKLGYWIVRFSELTSPKTGIFRTWDEGDLPQLPLAQCRVQAAHPETGGVLPEVICAGLTHEEARREAGLAGIEAYAACLFGTAGAGAGETAAEAVCRGLQRVLEEELSRRNQETSPVYPVQLQAEDETCRYYWQVLNTLQSRPAAAVGKEVAGFPSVWIGTNRGWTNSTGLNVTLAMRNALKKAIQLVQSPNGEGQVKPPVPLQNSFHLIVPPYELDERTLFLQAESILEQEGRSVEIEELDMGPLLKEGIAGVFRVALREEEAE
ncbi:bacteriocin maturation protein [Bacillus sp. FJAT-42376]|uniref:bacteriocin maturation protein n=1 Tax=Bacillus sp. FJAT-42376 TaxID=2014076 RepID=UPI000F4FB685|nr:bacteriocin maturation protein [Bacillus sp. FJAT-42376]AZB41817.1 bacteriocin maturation protein [Bacillus sp. FJAT-42376]